jgi:hypothetical protein
MFDRIGYCSPDSVDMKYIEKQSLNALEAFKNPDTVFMSPDVYSSFLHKTLATTRFYDRTNSTAGLNIDTFVTSAGILKLQPVPNLENFCLVGTQRDFENVEWMKIDKEFEEIFLKNGVGQ